jgi:AmpD protein
VNTPITNGWLDGVRMIASPNFNKRPPKTVINLLVIHNISLPPGEFGTGCVEAFFCNQLDHSRHPYFATLIALQVSAHFFIARTGEVTQLVPVWERAWHAGVSAFEGIANCNDYSLGIELEGCDDIPYTDAQYAALVQLTRRLQALFPGITSDRIVGHSDIAPERKTDPGPAFDWARYFDELSRDS